jgi:hypothetical protein
MIRILYTLLLLVFLALVSCKKETRYQYTLLTDTTAVHIQVQSDGVLRHRVFTNVYPQRKVYVVAFKELVYSSTPAGSLFTPHGFLEKIIDSTVTDNNGLFHLNTDAYAPYDRIYLKADLWLDDFVDITPGVANSNLLLKVKTITFMEGRLQIINNFHPPINIMLPESGIIGSWTNTEFNTQGSFSTDSINTLRYQYVLDSITHTRYDTIRLSAVQDTVHFDFIVDGASF